MIVLKIHAALSGGIVESAAFASQVVGVQRVRALRAGAWQLQESCVEC